MIGSWRALATARVRAVVSSGGTGCCTFPSRFGRVEVGDEKMTIQGNDNQLTNLADDKRTISSSTNKSDLSSN